jgi:N-acetylglucosaminyldiphosphoundecaprenol N-acetyl-beta-D-mannosaminyltransferase
VSPLEPTILPNMNIGETAARAALSTMPSRNGVPRFTLLGVNVSAIQIPQAIDWMEHVIGSSTRSQYICVTGMHGVTEAQSDPSLKTILNEAGLVVPDGMPLVWAGRANGFPLKRRVYGPELMQEFCSRTRSRYRHYFFGGAPGVPERLAEVLKERYDIQVAGCWSPPFRPLTEDEELDLHRKVKESAAEILWVGLSTPKQERWMHAHRDQLPVPLMVGVGAAFDFHTGRIPQAPRWMRENGLEWLFRLVQEPRRLWKRYLVLGPQFAGMVLLEALGIKKY